MPHKHLWRLADATGAVTACDLETLHRNRLLLRVTQGGDTIISETFADKRDALARSVAIYKDLKATGAYSDAER